MKKHGTNTYPEKHFYRHCLRALILCCSLLWNQTVNANDTYYIDEWRSFHNLFNASLPNVHIGFFFLDLTTRGLPDAQRVITHEEFNLDRDSFQNLLTVYFELARLRSRSPSVEFPPRRLAVSILLEIFNRNLEAAGRSGQNRQMLQQQFGQFYESFTVIPQETGLPSPFQHIRITFERYFQQQQFNSAGVNEFYDVNNGLMALMYATFVPFISSQQGASGMREERMHADFDFIQRSVICPVTLPESGNPWPFRAYDISDIFIFQPIDALVRHIREHYIDADLLMLISLRSFASYAYHNLVHGGRVETDFLPVIREFIRRDIPSVLVRRILECRARTHSFINRGAHLSNAFEYGVHAANNPMLFVLLMHCAMAIARFSEQDPADTQQLFNALLGGEPVFSVTSPVEQVYPEPGEAGSASSQGTSHSDFQEDLSNRLRRLLQIIADQVASENSGQASQTIINWLEAHRMLVTFILPNSRNPQRNENIQQSRPIERRDYSLFSGDVSEMAVEGLQVQTRPEPEPRRNTPRLVSRYISVLENQLDERGRLVTNQLSSEAQGVYDFFRGYLRFHTLRIIYEEQSQRDSVAGPQPISGNLTQNSEAQTAVISHSQSEPSDRLFGLGDPCAICKFEVNRTAVLAACGHCNFCSSCIDTLLERDSPNFQALGSGFVICPICRKINWADQIRRYDPPGGSSAI